VSVALNVLIQDLLILVGVLGFYSCLAILGDFYLTEIHRQRKRK
jgi:hypothetical protein